MAKLFSLPKTVPLSSGGALLPGAKLYFFATDTSTPQNTYQDSGLTTAHANPVVADASGVFAPIYLNPSLPNYRVRLTTSADVQLYQVDGVPSNENEAQTFRLASTAPQLIFEDTDATANLGKYALIADSNSFRLTLLNDAEVAQSHVMLFSRTSASQGAFIFLAGNSGGLSILDDGSGNVDVLSGGTGLFRYRDRQIGVHFSGFFTGTFTGFSSANTRQVEYNVFGDPTTNGASGLVVLSIPTGVATSNATTMTMTGIPASLAASVGCLQPVFVTDNGANVAGSVRILLGSATTLRFGVGAAEGGFTGSGNKGFPTTGEWLQVMYRTAG